MSNQSIRKGIILAGGAGSRLYRDYLQRVFNETELHCVI